MLEVKFSPPSVNPQPWRLTNNSLGLPHVPSLSVFLLFLWVCVVCVCFLLCLSIYLCCACFVFGFIHNHLCVFLLLFLQNLIDTSVTVPIEVHINLRIFLNSFSIYIFIHLHPAYVYVKCIRIALLFHIRTRLSPFSYVLFVLCAIFTPMFLFTFFSFQNLIDTCVTVSSDVIYPYSYPSPLIPSVSPLCDLYIHHHTVLIPTLVHQTSKLYNDMHLWIHRNSIQTWLQSKYLQYCYTCLS